MEAKTLSSLFSKVIEQEGEGIRRPTNGTLCTVSLSLLNGSPNDNKILNSLMSHSLNGVSTLHIGDGALTIDTLLETCLRTMRKCEIATMFIDPQFDSLHNVAFDQAPTFRIELLDFIHCPISVWEQTSEELISNAGCLKHQGVKLYQTNNIIQAFHKFSNALKFLIAVTQDNLNDDSRKTYKDLRLTCYLNLAACQMKTSNYQYVVLNCNKALELDPNNIKALFRRGVAYANMMDYDNSIEDLTATLSLDPKNKAVFDQLKAVREKNTDRQKAYADVVKKMFR